uniref:Thymosin beta 1 n=1 Tax=Xiphophorus maculatus TaxID=8083 RepID=A0A3B5R9C7_XIPMA
MGDNNPVNQEVEQFNKQKLKKTNTEEKNRLPTKEGRSEFMGPSPAARHPGPEETPDYHRLAGLANLLLFDTKIRHTH